MENEQSIMNNEQWRPMNNEQWTMNIKLLVISNDIEQWAMSNDQ